MSVDARDRLRRLAGLVVAVVCALALLASAGRRGRRPITALLGAAVHDPGRRPPRRRDHLHGREPADPAEPERLQLRGRQRRDRPPPGRASSATRTRRPQCSIADFSADDCPIDSQVGIVDIVSPAGDPVQFISAVYNLVPPPDESPACSASSSSSSTRRSSPCSAPAPDSDYGLDATATSIFHGSSSAAGSSSRSSGGCPPTRSTTRCGSTRRSTPARSARPLRRRLLRRATAHRARDDPNTVVKPCGGRHPADRRRTAR